MYLDRFYNEKLSVSVSGGRGEFTMTDHTPDTTIQKDLVEDAVADKTNDPYGLLAQTVYDVSEKGDTHKEKRKRTSLINSLTWNEMVQILREEKDLVDSAKKFQRCISEYYSLKPDAPTYHAEYRTWLGKTLDQLYTHREKLSEKLGRKLVSSSKLGKSILKITPYLEGAAGGGAGILVGAGQIAVSLSSVGLGAVAGVAAIAGVRLLSYSSLKLLESRAVGRYRTSFNKSIQLKSDKDLLR